MKKRDIYEDFRIPFGLNLNVNLYIARRLLGCLIECIRRTGEIRVSHPRMKKPCSKLNARRKDSARCLTRWLRNLHEVLRK
jgi:hypothetical protein